MGIGGGGSEGRKWRMEIRGKRGRKRRRVRIRETGGREGGGEKEEEGRR